MPSTIRPALFFALAGLALPACGKSPANSKTSQRKVTMKIGGAAAPGAVTANVAGFDPNADVVLDLDKFGSERPDQYEVQQAFFGAFEPIGHCVESEKQRRKSPDVVFDGDVTLAVKLNPSTGRPFGVNAQMPSGFEKADKLSNCLREAAGGVRYPVYDGPPLVVEFEFELDPGYID
jgi:hypothetical protein